MRLRHETVASLFRRIGLGALRPCLHRPQNVNRHRILKVVGSG